jgi:hypothetical protein
MLAGGNRDGTPGKRVTQGEVGMRSWQGPVLALEYLTYRVVDLLCTGETSGDANPTDPLASDDPA